MYHVYSLNHILNNNLNAETYLGKNLWVSNYDYSKSKTEIISALMCMIIYNLVTKFWIKFLTLDSKNENCGQGQEIYWAKRTCTCLTYFVSEHLSWSQAIYLLLYVFFWMGRWCGLLYCLSFCSFCYYFYVLFKNFLTL